MKSAVTVDFFVEPATFDEMRERTVVKPPMMTATLESSGISFCLTQSYCLPTAEAGRSLSPEGLARATRKGTYK